MNLSVLRAIPGCMITVIYLVACFTGGVGRAYGAAPLQTASIESISVSGSGDAAELILRLSTPATYSSYKATAPLRLVMDLSQTTPGNITVPLQINKGNFKTVTASRFDTDAGVLTRVDIELVRDQEPTIVVTPDKPGEVRISFAPGTRPVAAPEINDTVAPKDVLLPDASTIPAKPSVTNIPPIVPSTAVHTLTALGARGGKIVLAIDGGVGVYKTVTYHKPDRLVIDFSDTNSALANTIIPLEALGGSVATVGQLSGRLRVIIEPQSGKLPDFDISAVNDGLVISPRALIETEKPAATSTPENVLKLTATRSGVKKQDGVATDSQVDAKERVRASSSEHAGPTVEMIDFQVLDGISRVAIKVSGDVKVEPPQKGNGFVTVILKNTVLPVHLQRSLETQAFASPVLRVTPMVVKHRTGNDTQIRISLRVDAEYSLKRIADMVYVDFQNPAGGMLVDVSSAHTASETASTSGFPVPHASSNKSESPDKKAAGKNVSLDFDNAELRHIFRLLADVSQKNFIIGDDVKGTMSIRLTNVPWEQALDLILDSKGLVLRENGNVISIMTKETSKAKAKDELELQEQKARAEKDKAEIVELHTGMYNLNYSDLTSVVSQLNNLKTKRGSISQDARTNKIIVTDLPDVVERMGKLVKLLDIPEKQVMIEARIVEATSTFTRSLGVNWGVHFRDGSAALLGINQFDSSFGGLTNTAPPLTGVNGQAGGVAGISFGTLTSNIQLDLRLNAAASAGLIKIVSTPKVATLNNKTAKITQGQQVPYTSSTSDKVETKFVEAALSLEVTPHINSNGTIGMKIDAKNDSVGQATGGSTAPAINKKQATTEMLLRDGETTVIGGIYVDNDTESDDGVPYLMDIPYLGKLFRSNTKTKIKTELLIFITPRILGDM